MTATSHAPRALLRATICLSFIVLLPASAVSATSTEDGAALTSVNIAILPVEATNPPMHPPDGQFEVAISVSLKPRNRPSCRDIVDR
ncbi:MAG: hypothetical protein WKF41_18255 [Gaiellaceae bacterium]